jgi:hypothetical protein
LKLILPRRLRAGRIRVALIEQLPGAAPCLRPAELDVHGGDPLHGVGGTRPGNHAVRSLLVKGSLGYHVLEVSVGFLVARRLRVSDVAGDVLQRERLCLQTGDGGVQRSEELVEVAPAEYVSRDAWDRGFLGHDENGDEIPIRDDARLTVRWLQGKVLLVAKGSLWNSDPANYDGRHNGMTAAQIRTTIERSAR